QEITGVGTLTINANGSYKFTPAENFYGDLPPITYTVSDGKGGTATATLSITVTSVNDAPVAFNDTVSIAEDSAATTIDVLSNDRDIDGGTLAVTSFTINGDTVTYTANAGSNTASLPGKGTLTLNANGTFTFTPAANFYGDLPPITYTVSDGKGGTAMGTLSITVASVNDAPASASNSIVVDEDTSHTFQVSDFGFSDSLDTPSNALTRILITSVQAPAGTLTYEGAAIDLGSSPFTIEAADIAKLQFTPAPNAHGSGYASFTFQVQDDGGTDRGGQNTSAVYTLTINVTSVNDAPVNNSASESLSVRNDRTLSDLGLSVFDVDGAEDLASVTVSVSHGTLSVQGNASSSLTLTGTQAEINALLAALVYTPEPTYTGADTLTLVTFDDAGASATSTTSLTVSAASLLGGSGSSGGSGVTSGGSGSGGFGSTPPTTSGNGTSSAPPPPTETSGNPVTTAGPPATDPIPPSSTPTTTPTTTPFTPVPPSPGSTFGSTPPPVVPASGVLEGLLAEFHPRDFRDNPLSQEAALPPALQRMLALWSFDAMYTEAPDDGFRVAVHPDTGVSLAVFRGMPDQFVEADGMSFFSVPSDSFFHTLQAVRIRLHATLADGSPLPPWIALDALTGVFALTPPRGFQGELAIRLMARDGQGLEAATLFRLHVGERAQAQLRDGGVAGRSALSDQLREASRQREPALAPRAPQEAPPRVLQPT
ncbi:MAG: Hemolysin, plasmid, partial [Pseudomonadota bacterium]